MLVAGAMLSAVVVQSSVTKARGGPVGSSPQEPAGRW